MSPLLRASRPARAVEHRKSTKIDPPEGPKSTQDQAKSLRGALCEPLRAPGERLSPVDAPDDAARADRSALGHPLRARWFTLPPSPHSLFRG